MNRLFQFSCVDSYTAAEKVLCMLYTQHIPHLIYYYISYTQYILHLRYYYISHILNIYFTSSITINVIYEIFPTPQVSKLTWHCGSCPGCRQRSKQVSHPGLLRLKIKKNTFKTNANSSTL